MFYKPVLIITDPELIQNVLIKDFNSFHDRPFPIDAAKRYPLIGHLFSARGQNWKDLRVKMSPAFTSGKIKVMLPIINECADVLLKFIEENVEDSKNVFEFRDLFSRLTTDIISSVAFGIENDSINNRDNEMRKMGTKLFENNLRKATFNLFALLTPNLFVKLGIDPFGKEITEFMYSLVKQTVD
jgi:cytochrome P450 family 6